MAFSDPFGITYAGAYKGLSSIGEGLQAGTEALAKQKQLEQLSQVKMIGELISSGYLVPATKEEGTLNVGGFPFKLGQNVKEELAIQKTKMEIDKIESETENLNTINEKVQSGQYREKGVNSSGEISYERIPTEDEINKDIEKKVKEKEALKSIEEPTVEEKKYARQEEFNIDKQKALDAINRGKNPEMVLKRLESAYGDRLDEINRFRIELLKRIKVKK